MYVRLIRFLSVAVLAVAVSGCVTNGTSGQSTSSKPLIGTLLGGALGGYGGSKIGKGSGKTWATIGGTLLGAYIGNSVGKSLERADQLSAMRTAQVALERNRIGQGSTWRNPDPRRQTYCSVTPTRTYQENGRYCREYQQDITVGGKTERAYGRACRQPDGTWQIVNNQSSGNASVPVWSNSSSVYNRPSSVYNRNFNPRGPVAVYRTRPATVFAPRYTNRCYKVWVEGHRQYGHWRQGHYRRVCPQ